MIEKRAQKSKLKSKVKISIERYEEDMETETSQKKKRRKKFLIFLKIPIISNLIKNSKQLKIIYMKHVKKAIWN